MFTSNLLRIFGMHAMLVRYIIHFVLLLCPDCIIYITKYRANYEFHNCLHNEKFTLSEYLQIQSQHSFFMSIHSGKAALLKYFWKANTKWILNTDKRRVGETNAHSMENTCWIKPGVLCVVLPSPSSHCWSEDGKRPSVEMEESERKLNVCVSPSLAQWFRIPSHAQDDWNRGCPQLCFPPFRNLPHPY